MKNHTQWEALVYRPQLPEGWFVEEQRTNARSSTITFVRWGKIHHLDEPRKIYLVFTEKNPYSFVHEGLTKPFVIRGGRNSQPDENVRHFENLKDAEKWLLNCCKQTDKWVENQNSHKTIEAYDKRIADLKTRLEKHG